MNAVMPGYTFGCEPLLICYDYNGQAYIGPNQWSPPSGVDFNSRDIRLVSSAPIVNAPYANITIDGNPKVWAALPCSVVSMNTQGRGTNGTLAVDIKYAWDYTNLYVLCMENTNQYVATAAQEATSASDYQNQPWLRDTIAFWMDLTNGCGLPDGSGVQGEVVTKNNADFQPWFGFSSADRTDLIYARQDDSGSMNLGGLANCQVATSGTFALHNRVVEAAIKWADIAASVDPARQPGGNIATAIGPGYTFGCEPLLILVDYNGQSFIGPNQWSPGNGIDIYSRDIRLMSGAQVIGAAYGSNIKIDGSGNDWASLPSTKLSMNTFGRGANGTLAVDIKYAWDYTNLYVLVNEDTNQYVATAAQEATSASDYQNQPWLRDTIAFWMDMTNGCGLPDGNGGIIVKNNADFQPWFGFSSTDRTDLIYARQDDSGTMNLGGVANCQVATSGTFTKHNRVIEVAMKWADMAASVDPARQPGGDIATAIQPGYTFGFEPLLICVDYNGQSFIGGNQYTQPSGVDANSCDVVLLDSAQTSLSLTRTNWSGNSTNQIVLNWQGSNPGYVIQASAGLNPANWVQVGSPFLDVDGLTKVLISAPTQKAMYYRLKKPLGL